MVGAPLLALLLLLPQGDTSQKVTFHMAAAPMSRVLEALSQTTKVPMAASKKTAPDVMVIDVKDVSLKDLMDRIALADTAEWTLENGTYKLNPATGKRNVEARQEIQRKVNVLKKGIHQQLLALKKGIASQENEVDGEWANPETQDLLQIVLTLNLADLVQLQPDERIVYATHPNSLQRPLGPAVNDLIASMVRHHNQQLARLARMQEESDEDEPGLPEELVRALSPQMLARMKHLSKIRITPITVPVAKVILAISGIQGGNGMANTVDLLLYDAKGRVLKQAQANLLRNSPEEASSASFEEPKVRTKLEWSEITQKVKDSYLAIQNGMEECYPKDLQVRLDRPDLYDPLSYFASETVFTYARQNAQPLVAVLPDEMITIGSNGPYDSLEAFQHSLSSKTSLKELQDRDWIVLVPSSPERARQERLDRVAYTRLLQSVVPSMGPSLDVLAEYAVSHPDPNWSPATALHRYYNLDGRALTSDETSWSALRFYGLLSPADRSLLKEGKTLSIKSLSAAQRTALSQLAFASYAILYKMPPGSPIPNPDDPEAVYCSLSTNTDVDSQDEPTEALASAFSGYGGLIARTTEEFFVVTKGSGIATYERLGATELAARQLFLERLPTMKDSALSKVGKVGKRTVWNFTMRLNQQLSCQFSLVDDRLDADTKEVRLDNLPEPLKQKIAAKLEMMKHAKLQTDGLPAAQPPLGGTP